jgi:uncharacterized protein YceH (UPF0502 family)
MQFGTLTAPEQRVLGCLLEKRLTTPDQYPLSLNSLRLACNQSTNRNPVVSYDESTVREAAQRLCKHGLARLASGHTSRATKYRHLAQEALGLGHDELAVLAVLLLRGAQTPGELKSRSERMAHLESLADVERILDALEERGYVRRLHRRPGQKEDRFEQLFGEEADADSAAPSYADSAAPSYAGDSLSAGPAEPLEPMPVGDARPAFAPPSGVNGADGDLAARVAALEADVAALKAEMAALRQA